MTEEGMTRRRLGIRFGDVQRVDVRIRPEPTSTIEALLASLPFESTANRWGAEVYFEAPFHSELEKDARAEMSIGDVAYWPDGNAIAIFFGRTPASTDERPKAYSPCNIIGSVESSLAILGSIRAGDKVVVAYIESLAGVPAID